VSALILALAVTTGVDREVLAAFEPGATAEAVAAGKAIEDPFKTRPEIVAVPIAEERLAELGSFIHEHYHHTPNDTLANSGGTALTSMPFVKLAAAYMAEIAKGGFTAPASTADDGEAQGRKTDVKAALSGRKDSGR
jgi:bacterial leucyl aminopeptidase